jgi:O-antigen/teichoic acid export membrane protein
MTRRSVRRHFRSKGTAHLARNAASMFLGQGGRAVLQALFFVLLTRSLGVAGFGAFAGVLALVAVAQPFAALGAPNLMVMRVARDADTARAEFATAVTVTAVTGLVAALAIAFVSHWVSAKGTSGIVALQLALAELLGARVVDVAGALYQAQERLLRMAVFSLAITVARLGGAVTLTVAGESSVGAWSAAYLAVSMAAAVGVVAFTFRAVGLSRPSVAAYLHHWKDGLQFSVGLAAQSIYNDIDKSMLARMSTLEATGIYAAAYRIVDLAFVPMRALLGAAYARFFRYGDEGIARTAAFARRLAGPGVGYCVFASVGLLSLSSLVPRILGPSYEDSVHALRWLSILPLLKAIHYLAADALTGARLQRVRTRWQLFVAALNVLLNLWLIPAFSWRGAAVASLLADGALAIGLWLTIVRLRRYGQVATRTRPPQAVAQVVGEVSR